MDNQPDQIRQQMTETRAALTDKLETLEHQVLDSVQDATAAVSETVTTVKEAVQETVGTLKESVQETVHTVQESLSLRRQFDRHPWVMLAGGVAVGYLAGSLLFPEPRRAARGPVDRARPLGPRLYQPEAEPVGSAQPRGWLARLRAEFAPELQQVKAAAIGTTLAFFRDLLTPSLPPSLGQRLHEVINGMTTRMGGTPVPEPIVASTPNASRPERRAS
jgi:ElaB/YqjD/DUF883 family membrane-anchored ribosome-binding protein